MYFAHTALTVACVIIILAKGQGQNKESQENADDNVNKGMDKFESKSIGIYNYAAIIDIVFVDDSKRTCTGAIVHDHVVITAAHCFFGRDRLSPSKAELTASFVVVGTRRMFETGYEQYLPIERILVHPKYEGWTADLALVFTFAAMTSDKPGTIIQLAGDKITAHLDSNLTLLSWHLLHRYDQSTVNSYVNKYDDKDKNASPHSEESCDSESEHKKHTKSPNKRGNTVAMVMKRVRNQRLTSTNFPSIRFKKNKYVQNFRANDETHEVHMQRHHNYPIEEIILKNEKRSSQMSRYLFVDSFENIESSISPFVYGSNESNQNIKQYGNNKVAPRLPGTKFITSKDHILSVSREKSIEKTSKEKLVKRKEKKKMPRVLYSFKTDMGWRRNFGATQNRLAVEIFGFVNLQSCRALVDKALPKLYNISKHHNDVICYTNTDRCVDESDSGALALQQGKLVAITVGGAECDGDHVAVGMKMSCFCSWISDNLPLGSTPFHCCKNCCDVIHKEEKKKARRYKPEIKFI